MYLLSCYLMFNCVAHMKHTINYRLHPLYIYIYIYIYIYSIHYTHYVCIHMITRSTLTPYMVTCVTCVHT